MTSNVTFVILCIIKKKFVNTLFLVVEAHVSSYSHGHWFLSDALKIDTSMILKLKKKFDSYLNL
jgi:hypothetical protein